MKKLLLVLPLLFSFHFAEAQYRFYAGLEMGPKWTFTENLTGGGNKTTDQEIGFSGGAVFSYVLPNKRISFQTGFIRSSFDFKHNMEYGPYPFYPSYHYWPDNYIEPELIISTRAIQIPLRLKSRLYQSKNEKWSLWFSGGGIFTAFDYNKQFIKGNFIVEKDVPFWNTLLSRQIDEATVSPKMHFKSFSDFDPTIMIETGLELGYQINNRFQVNILGRHQSGLKSIFISQVKDIEKEVRSGQRITNLTSTSNGNGIYLNLGLTYSFGKRNKESIPTKI